MPSVMPSRTARSPIRFAGSEKTLLGFFALTALGIVGAVALNQKEIRVYEWYGDGLLHGSAAAALPREYPALAGLFFSLVALMPGPYLGGFSLCMVLALAGLVLFGTKRLGRSGWAERVLLYLALAVFGVLFARYDLLPAACTFGAVVWASEGRFGRAWVAACLGAALKLFPALLLPGFFIYEWRTTGRPPGRRVLATGLAAGAIAVVQTWLAPGTLLNPFRYELRRGFEFSSVGGGITFLTDPLHASWHFAFGAWQISGTGAGPVKIAMLLLEVTGIAGVWWLLSRRRLTLQAASLAVLSVAVLCDRALGPQYLIWLAPLWALWPLRREWVAAAFLTTLTFPVVFHLFPTLTVATIVALLRNGALAVGTFLWFRAELRSPVPMELFSGRDSRRRGCVIVKPLTAGSETRGSIVMSSAGWKAPAGAADRGLASTNGSPSNDGGSPIGGRR